MKSLICALQITHCADVCVSIKMAEISQQRPEKKLLLVLTWISSFKVQTVFRHDFETAAGTGLINAFLPSRWVTEITYPSAVVIGCRNYEKANKVPAQKNPINWNTAVFAGTMVAVNMLKWGCCSGNLGMWSFEPEEVMQMFIFGRHWGPTDVAQVCRSCPMGFRASYHLI